MLLYNVTFGIDQQVEDQWVLWMKANYIPNVMKTGLFLDFKFYKILVDNEDGTSSYSVQYFANSLNDIEKYLEFHASQLIQEHNLVFRDRHIAFRTLLQEI